MVKRSRHERFGDLFETTSFKDCMGSNLDLHFGKSSSFHGSPQTCKNDENVGGICDIHSVAGK